MPCASGLDFKDDEKFAAHYEIPCSSEIEVTSLVNDKRVVLRVLDKAGSSLNWQNIKLALSPAAAKELGIVGKGQVKFKVIKVP